MKEIYEAADRLADAVKKGAWPVDSVTALLTAIYAHRNTAAQRSGWYCAHCERAVDPVEVTFHEQHAECGRVITDDAPPATPDHDREAARIRELEAENERLRHEIERLQAVSAGLLNDAPKAREE